MVTTDAAMNFSAKRKFPYSTNISAIDMIDMQRGFVANPTGIYYTPDAGITWAPSYSGTSYIHSIRIAGKHVYAATFNDSIILKLDISFLVSVSEDKGSKAGISVFPNPATDQVQINLPGNSQAKQARISDQLGRLIRVEMVSETQTLDVSGLTPGIYVLNVLAGNRNYNVKLMIADK